VQDRYWQHCFIQEQGNERYLYPCPAPAGSPTVSAAVIVAAFQDPQLEMLLREWTSSARVIGNALLRDQQDAAMSAIDAVAHATALSD
jgi:hypothetical protein